MKPEMDEGRKRTLLIAACVLAARKLMYSPALESCIALADHDGRENHAED
jgi:hypothetical protein